MCAKKILDAMVKEKSKSSTSFFREKKKNKRIDPKKKKKGNTQSYEIMRFWIHARFVINEKNEKRCYYAMKYIPKKN